MSGKCIACFIAACDSSQKESRFGVIETERIYAARDCSIVVLVGYVFETISGLLNLVLV